MEIKKRTSDVYDDIELPWVDTKVAAALCIGGPCKYKVVDEHVTDAFILQHCVPHMRQGISEKSCIIFGTALLYAAFSDLTESSVPPDITARIKSAYNRLERRGPPLTIL